MTNNNRFMALKIKVRPKGLHKSLTPDPWPLPPNIIVRKDLHVFKALYNCRDFFTDVMSALQISPICSNKPNFQKSQMNVTKVITSDYDKMDTWSIRKNKPNSNPIQSQFKPNQSQNKPNTNPNKPNFKANIMLNLTINTRPNPRADYPGQLYRKLSLDCRKRNATVKKDLAAIKRLCTLPVNRNQLYENPLLYSAMPKLPKMKINIYTSAQRQWIQIAAQQYTAELNTVKFIKWDFMITVALATPMRRPELMNCTWADVDFDTQTIEVNLKDNTKDTWKWLIKDAEHNCEKIVFRRERWLRYVKVAGQ
jgi:hypothetical protein